MPRTDRASRVIAAPLDRVYAALVDPEALTAWWRAPRLPAHGPAVHTELELNCNEQIADLAWASTGRINDIPARASPVHEAAACCA